MWSKIAHIILRQREILIITLAVCTIFFAGNIPYNQVSYDLSRLLPVGDSTATVFEDFKKKYGANDNVYLVSTEDPALFELENFGLFYDFTKELQKLPAVDSVFSVANFGYLKKNKFEEKFYLETVFKDRPIRQSQIDTALDVLKNQPFYERILYLSYNGTDTIKSLDNKGELLIEIVDAKKDLSIISISLDADSLKTSKRNVYVLSVAKKIDEFSKKTGVKFNYSGMPYIRSKLSTQVEKEIKLFIGLAIGLTALLLYFFLKAPRAVLVSLLVVSVAVVWLLGTIGFLSRLSDWGYTGTLNFRINILTSLLPPLVIVIGIPNCIFLLNKYFGEYKEHKNQAKALTRVIEKIGGATFMTNATTASGFATFIFASSDILKEFGIVASISIMSVFILSLLLLPIVYSYISPPKEKHYKHLDYKWSSNLIDWFVNVCSNYRGTVYVLTIAIALLAGYGMSLINNNALVVDDIPDDNPVMVDLKYYEKAFNGVIPFEILINTNISKVVEVEFSDSVAQSVLKNLEHVSSIKYLGNNKYKLFVKTGKNITSTLKDGLNGQAIKSVEYKKVNKKGKALKLSTLKKVDKLYGVLKYYKELSRPLSVLDVIKHSKQAYYNGDPDEYSIPIRNEIGFISKYASGTKKESSKLLRSFLTLDKSELRISMQMKDIGTKKTAVLLEKLREDVDQIFNPKKYKVEFTGIGVIVTKGVDALVSNLIMSLLLTVLIIAVLMAFMFRNFRMVFISLLPNILPLFITAAIMGYCGINIKPSTILVFSIAFGISVDDTIHFLAKYRQELSDNNGEIRISVLSALRETGISMFYTSVVLFFGFGIFVASDFGGTVALGLLVSLTLLIAMLSNLILLPCLLLSLDKLISLKTEEKKLN